MKKLLLSLTLLVAANGYAAEPTILENATSALTTFWDKITGAEAAKSKTFAAKTYALIEAAKKNPAYTAGAVAVTVAGVWALHKTYRYFVPKKAARA